MTDAEYVKRVLAGDVDAYTTLVDRYYERCARFAVRMLGNQDDAEDALQATFVRAYRALDRYQERDKFSAWLYRILVNQCRSLAARRSHREKMFVREEAALLAHAPRHIQALLIAFSFGAFIEGCAGFGAPVAITAALLVGLVDTERFVGCFTEKLFTYALGRAVRTHERDELSQIAPTVFSESSGGNWTEQGSSSWPQATAFRGSKTGPRRNG